jgi:hypothetical protein
MKKNRNLGLGMALGIGIGVSNTFNQMDKKEKRDNTE